MGKYVVRSRRASGGVVLPPSTGAPRRAEGEDAPDARAPRRDDSARHVQRRSDRAADVRARNGPRRTGSDPESDSRLATPLAEAPYLEWWRAARHDAQFAASRRAGLRYTDDGQRKRGRW